MFQRKTRAGRIAGASCSRGMIAAAFAGLAVAAVAVPRAGAAATTVYSDVPDTGESLAGSVYFPNGTPSTIGSGLYTPLVADLIAPITGYDGQTVTSTEFSVFNGGSTPVTFVPELRFYSADPSTGEVSTLLYSQDAAPITLAAGATGLYVDSLPTTGNVFSLPPAADGFWAGLAFTDQYDGVSTGATASQLADLGQLVWNPVTVGTGADLFFLSDTASTYTASDPTTGGYENFNEAPVANFAWQFSVQTSVPEPASAGVIGVAAAAGLVRRRRRVQI